jgi:hypothetical protein
MFDPVSAFIGGGKKEAIELQKPLIDRHNFAFNESLFWKFAQSRRARLQNTSRNVPISLHKSKCFDIAVSF